MKLIDGKSLLLGLGMGIVITSLLGAIYFIGYKPQLSDAEIIALSQKLGMVDPYSGDGDIRRNADGSLIFTIHEGETYTEVSQRLNEAGVINSTIEFDIIVKKQKLEQSIKPGSYTITYDDDVKSIIQKITQ